MDNDNIFIIAHKVAESLDRISDEEKALFIKDYGDMERVKKMFREGILLIDRVRRGLVN